SSALASTRNPRMMVVQSWNGYEADTSVAVSYWFESPNTAGNLLIACMVSAAPVIRMEDSAGNQYLLAASYKIPAGGDYFDNYYISICYCPACIGCQKNYVTIFAGTKKPGGRSLLMLAEVAPGAGKIFSFFGVSAHGSSSNSTTVTSGSIS